MAITLHHKEIMILMTDPNLKVPVPNIPASLLSIPTKLIRL